MTTLVALTGKRGSGKSLGAELLIKNGYTEIKFADPLKNMLRAFFKTCGETEEYAERCIEGDLKEEPNTWLMGKTPRHAMQTLGTEWRDMIGTDMWSEIFSNRVKNAPEDTKFVCSDFRFPHEEVVLRKLGCTIIKIDREKANVADEASQHISETVMDELGYDALITNNYTIDALHNNIREVLKCNHY